MKILTKVWKIEYKRNTEVNSFGAKDGYCIRILPETKNRAETILFFDNNFEYDGFTRYKQHAQDNYVLLKQCHNDVLKKIKEANEEALFVDAHWEVL